MYILIMSSDARIKSKFWGKSMEVFPVGTVNVTIPKLAPNRVNCVCPLVRVHVMYVTFMYHLHICVYIRMYIHMLCC